MVVHHTYPHPYIYMYLNFVFLMSSPLPLLHTAMPTPCLKTFWHIDPSEVDFCGCLSQKPLKRESNSPELEFSIGSGCMELSAFREGK